MAFVKLDESLLNSTVWLDPDLSRVWVTMLLMARPFSLEEPAETYTLDIPPLPAGFTVPAGDYGIVEAAAPAILVRARITHNDGIEVLKRLSSVEDDPYSKTIGPKEFDGRRIARISGGFIVLNYMKYRNKDHSTARSKRWREARKDEAKSGKYDGAREALAYLNKQTGKNFQPVLSTLEACQGRINEYGLKEVKGVILDRCNRWKNDEKMAEYLRPSTLFRASNFANYFGELPT